MEWVSPQVLTDVDAAVARRGKSVSGVADALETSLQVFAIATLAHVRPLDALVDIDAI